MMEWKFVVSAVHIAFALFSLVVTAVSISLSHNWGGFTAYLTQWNLTMQMLYFVCCVAFDASFIMHGFASETLATHRDRFFVLSFVYCNTVAILYWTIIFPEDLERAVSTAGTFFMDLCQHLFIIFFAWTELFLCYHTFSRALLEIFFVQAFAFVYLGWNYIVHAASGWFPYPFQEHLTWVTAPVVYLGMSLVTLATYHLGWYVNNRVWTAPDHFGRCHTSNFADIGNPDAEEKVVSMRLAEV
eukprot:NODE_2046_length_1312_cov_22.082344_g1860_i0.p1 GENE.NODE_2046_length_1312_cov_22.082344_g1860_i0~~NODE_2046_length_1312_cov_22.082344_g1860_i0.p1  ORF type:complete len:243 (-),score=38.42 NODE_2046_length_1312_cov_22.082344_g1860_i0:458-1186(-)